MPVSFDSSEILILCSPKIVDTLFLIINSFYQYIIKELHNTFINVIITCKDVYYGNNF